MAIQKMKQGKGRVHLPKDDGDKRRLVYFLVQAVVADGKVAEKERKVLNTIIDKLDIPKKHVDKFIHSRLRELKTERYSSATVTEEGKSFPMECPKCGYEQAQRYQCKRCGIIFEKYKKKHGPSEEDQLRELLGSANTIKQEIDE